MDIGNGVKLFRAKELFTFEEFSKMADIVKLSRLDGKPAASDIAEQVVKPVLSRIEAKVGGAVDPLYLAYAAEQAINTFLDGKTGMVATEIPMTAFPEGPVN
jgi:hypothetical protein